MEPVMNEVALVEKILLTKKLGSKPTDTLSKIARYYRMSGEKPKQIRAGLEAFILQCEPRASIPKWEGRIDSAIKNSDRPLVQIESLPIYSKELAVVNNIKSAQLQKLAFSLLCYARFSDIKRGKSDHWVNNPTGDLASSAMIKKPSREVELMLNTLYSMGLIKFSRRVDSHSICVLFLNDEDVDDRVVYEVKDMRNLGLQLRAANGDTNLFICENCGIMTPVRNTIGRRRKYCDNCAQAVKIQQTVNHAMETRRRMRESTNA